MQRLIARLSSIRYFDRWLPWIFLLIALPVTFLIWQNEKSSADMDQQLRFEYRAEEAHSLIMKQLTVYQQSLIGIQSFFRASSFVSQEEFADYVEVLLHPSKHIGLQQVGFAKYVDLGRPETHETRRCPRPGGSPERWSYARAGREW